MMDIGIYALQAARYLSGEEPSEVSAMMYSTPGDPRFKEVEEAINFQLRFPSGILANCTSSYGYAWQSHYRVVTSEGWLNWTRRRPTAACACECTAETSPRKETFRRGPFCL